MKRITIGLCLFFYSLGCLHAQDTLRFSISVAGINIGELKAIKTGDVIKERYQLESIVDFWFFGKIKALVTTDALYEKDKFLFSVMNTHTNKGEFVSNIEWQKDRYHIDAESYKYKHKAEERQVFEYSGIKLFFEEPLGVVKLINEHYGKIAEIIPHENGYYEVIVAGNTNKYYYEKGQLVRAVMEHPIKNYVVRRIE